MAWIRLEPGETTNGGKKHYDGICEAADDLSDVENNGYAEYNGSRIEMAPGSAALCLADKKLYVLTENGFTEVRG